MNLKNQMIMEEYRESRETFARLGTTVYDILKNIAKKENIEPMALEYRVKKEDSLEGKLQLKGDKYSSLNDITDILGARFICFFSDEVYKVAKRLEEEFVIDWDNSIDKSTTLNDDSFGYLSVHYICSIPEDKGYPEEFYGRKFEIQLRTGLQHIWAAITHDTTYKSDFDVPHEVKRSLSRLAGLLELADDEFIRVRDEMNEYTESIRDKIINNEADDVSINAISLREYMLGNKEMRRFLGELASIEGSEISDISPKPYLEQLKWLGMSKLGDVQDMLKENEELALKLARQVLSGSELDILASNVGLFYLCRAELISKDYSQEQMAEFFEISNKDKKRAERQAKRLLENYGKLK